MEKPDAYKIAYERERMARIHAEQLLDEKSRSLYENYCMLERVIEDLKLTQNNLIQSEKMASIGQLAAGVAHEINNPVGFSLSNLTTLTDYLESFISLDDFTMHHIATLQDKNFSQNYLTLREKNDIEYITQDIKSLLADSIKGLNRVSEIVKSLKKVTHTSSTEKQFCNINQLIEESIKVVWNELKYHIEIERDFVELPAIQCYEGEIHQVLMNLFINASHACEDNPPERKGLMNIKTCKKMVADREWIAIDISDNGKGMSEAIMKKIFDPFFTTKPVGVGTGLGLSISFGIIERHGGKISVSSKEGKGSCFTICLPLQ